MSRRYGVPMRGESDEKKPLTVAVTGPHGFIGRALMTKLGEVGDRAIGLARRSTGTAEEIVVGDLSVAAISPSALAGVDVVVHLAALAHEIKKGGDAARYHEINVRGTAVMIEAAIAAKVYRFVFLSSVKAVGEQTQAGKPFASDSICAPVDAYGESKLAAEKLVRDQCDEAGVEWVIVRPPLVFGPGAKGNFALLVRLAGLGIPLPLGAIRNRRSILYLGNLVDALVAICHKRGIGGQILTLSDFTVSTPELIRATAKSGGRRALLFSVPVWFLQAVGRVTGRQAQIARLCESLEVDARPSLTALDWTPPFGLEAALKNTTTS